MSTRLKEVRLASRQQDAGKEVIREEEVKVRVEGGQEKRKKGRKIEKKWGLI